jgi:hypothetical protein
LKSHFHLDNVSSEEKKGMAVVAAIKKNLIGIPEAATSLGLWCQIISAPTYWGEL